MGVDVPASGPLGGSAPAAHSVRGWVGGVDERRSGLRGQLRRSSMPLGLASLGCRNPCGRRPAAASGSVSRHVRLSRPTGSPAPPTTPSGTPARASQVTVSSGVSPSGRVHLGNMREFLTVHFVADELRRRGVPVRHLHVWDDYDRFRKVPVGVDPSYAEHIGRPLSAVPDPWDCHASWAEHFKEPLLDALHAMGIEMEEISQTERYTSGLYREQVLLAVRHRHDIEAVLARYRTKKAAPEHASEQEAAALADSVADDEDPEGSDRAGAVPVQAVLPHVRTRHHHRHVLRRRDAPTSPTRAPTGTPTPPTSPRRTRGSWSGRSTGRCAGPSSTSTSSRPAWTTRRPARRSPSVTSWSRRSSGCRGRPGSATASWASPACRRCRRPRAARPPPRTPCACWRRRSCAGSTCAATPSRPSTSTSAPRSSGSTTSGTRWPARPRTPTSATSRCSPGNARRPRPPARCRRRRSSYRSACSPRSPTSRPAQAEQISRIVGDRGRRPPAAPRQGDGVDQRVRRPGRPHDRARVPRRGHARLAGRPAAHLAAAAARRARRAAAARRRHVAGLRRAQAGARDGPRRQADRRGQGRPEGVLRAALPPAGRRRARPAAAHPGDGAGHGARAVAARR